MQFAPPEQWLRLTYKNQTQVSLEMWADGGMIQPLDMRVNGDFQNMNYGRFIVRSKNCGALLEMCRHVAESPK